MNYGMVKEMKPVLYRKNNFKDHNCEFTWTSSIRDNKKDRPILRMGSDYDAFALHLASGSMDEVNVAHPYISWFTFSLFLYLFCPFWSRTANDLCTGNVLRMSQVGLEGVGKRAKKLFIGF